MGTLNLVDLISIAKIPLDDVVVIRHTFKKETLDISNIYGQHRREYTMSVRRICLILCFVAEDYYNKNKEKFHFNYELLD